MILEKAEEPEIELPTPLDHRKSKGIPKKICFIDYAKTFDCDHCFGSQQTVENSLRVGNTRPPYLPPEKPVCRSRSNRTRHGTTDWFQIGKGVHQGCILSPCLFNLYAEYTMQNAGLGEAQAGIKIAGRNINNLRYADDTTLMAENKEELKSLLMKMEENSEKSWLKTKQPNQKMGQRSKQTFLQRRHTDG